MSISPAPSWGTGVSFIGAGAAFLCDLASGSASGHLSHVGCLSQLRNISVSDTLAETITDTAS